MLKEFVFLCSKTPDEIMCHSIFSTLTNKELLNKNVNTHMNILGDNRIPIFKILREGRLVKIILDTSDFPNLKIENTMHFCSNSIEVKLLSQREFVPSYDFKNQDVVEIFGIMCYATKTKEGLRCPVHYKVHPDEDSKFWEYLLNLTGVRASYKYANLSPIGYRSYKSFNSLSNGNRLNFHNTFYLNIKGVVEDENKANCLDFCAIGKKRSYSFGSLFLQPGTLDER